jgi:hypothetical protein
MPYATIGEIVDDLASYADETDAQTYTIPPSRRRRLGHYIQRANDEIWGYRPWSFKYALKADIAFTAGHATMPQDMASVGEGGMFWRPSDNARSPWVEVHIQNMMAVRVAGRDLHKKWFAIGLLDQAEGTTGQLSREIWVPKDEPQTFSLFYEMSPPTFNLTDLDNEAVPLPELFHNTLFAGALAKLQDAKGDPKSIWRAEYLATLAKVTANFHVNSSRMEQMPNTVGGQW